MNQFFLFLLFLTVSFSNIFSASYIKVDNFLVREKSAQKISQFIQSLHQSCLITESEIEGLQHLPHLKRMCILEDLNKILYESFGKNIALDKNFVTHIKKCKLTKVNLYHKKVSRKIKYRSYIKKVSIFLSEQKYF